MASVKLLETIANLAPHLSAKQVTELRYQAQQIRDGLCEPVCAGDRAGVNEAYRLAMHALDAI